MKEGTPSDYELEKLAGSIARSWIKLGRRLGISDTKLDEIDYRWPELCEKAGRMLLCWKQENGPNATYKDLSEALCHPLVNRKDLAKDICFHGEEELSPSTIVGTSQGPPAQGNYMKEGTPSDDDLEELSISICKSWMKLGRRLEISESQLDGIDERWPEKAEKAHRMLKCWKQENGSAATYRVLSDALCHEFVNGKDLAEDICSLGEHVHLPESGMESRDANLVEDQLRSIPLYIKARGDEHKAAYQRALETGTTSDKRVKVMLIGQDRAGKTSVGRSLKGEEFRKDESSTEGVQMDKPLKQVGAKPWKNSTEEQETTAFDHKCAQAISDDLSTDRSSEGKALGNEEMTEKMADKKEFSVDDELHGPKKRETATKDAADLESYRNAKREDDIRVPDEVTRLTVKKLSQRNSDNDDKIWPVIWDFAGQAIYRAIHPIFLSREAIYVPVLDLTKELSAIAQCYVKELDHEEAKIPAPDSNDTNLDHIMRWMDLVHCFKHGENGEILPPVILVGTHADLLQDPGDKITKVEDKIRHTARVFSDHIIGKTFVNNTIAGMQEEDPQIVSLREMILKVGEGMPHTKDVVPLKWLQVENEVYDLASKGTNYITKEDFKKNICDEICQFEFEDDFDVLLHFLHDRGTVVYHGCANDKRSLVVLNPKWLVDTLCQIITVEKRSEGKAKIRNLREDLEMTGILHAELLDDSCERLKLRDIKDSLLDIMKKFNLLCEYTSKEGSSIYLVPCMLTSSPDELKLNIPGKQEPPPVYITFDTKYVPAGLFSRLVVLFMEYAQRIDSDQPELFANYAHLFIGKITGIQFVCYKRVIRVQVLDDTDSNLNPVEKEPDICLKLLSVLQDSLKSLHEQCHWLQAVSWDLCARCNLCPPELASKTTGECFWHGEKGCCHDDCAHYVSVTQGLFRCSRTKGRNRCPPKTWCQAKALKDLDEATRHKQRAFSEENKKREAESLHNNVVGATQQPTVFHNLQQMCQDADKTIRKKTTLSSDLKKNARDKGFKVSNNPGQGDCMFYALSEQVELTKGIKLSAAELRQELVQYLKEHPQLPDGTDLFPFTHGYPTWAAYLETMTKDGTWGDHVILIAAANCYNIGIRVISSLSGRDDIHINPDLPICDSGDALVLGHVHEEHYVSLLPIPALHPKIPSHIHPQSELVYPMTSKPRGITLIINNEKFFGRNSQLTKKEQNEEELKIRLGSEEDVKALAKLFEELGFRPRIERNKGRSEILRVLDDVSQEDHSAYDCFVLWLMSHGQDGKFYGADGETVHIETVRDFFNSANCPTLKGKPKLIFIQACRGHKKERGDSPNNHTQQPSTHDFKMPAKEAEISKSIPNHADMLIANSTISGYVSFRDEVKGSRFVRCIVEIFREFAGHEDVLSMLTMVNDRVSKMGESDEKQVSEPSNTLRRKLYFWPGM